MREAVIVEAVRTPLGRKNGTLSHIRPDELAAEVIKEIVNRTGIRSNIIEDVILGCVSQLSEQGNCIARTAGLIAGLPIDVPGTTVNRNCGSSQQAVHFAAQAIMSGDMDVIIAGGVESMTRVPIDSSLKGYTDSDKLTSNYEMLHQGVAAERIAAKWGFSRAQLDEFSLESHQRAISAIEEGRFEHETIPIEVTLPDGLKKTIKNDETPRKETSMEALATLKPVFQAEGKIHAGNSSQISDGSSALLMMSRDKANELGLKPRFRVHTRVVVGSDPTLMLTGPIPATKKALEKSGLTLQDIDVFEINEAFASVVLAWLVETGADPKKVNPNGGAIALGHPLGCSGTRLMTTMMYELERTGGRFGLQSMCEGGGMANATIIERLD